MATTPDLPRLATRATLLRLGVTDASIRWAIRRRWWTRMAPGIYLTAPQAGFTDRLAAAALHGGPDSVISGGARLHAAGFRSVREEPARILVLVDVRCGARSTPAIQIRRTKSLPRSSPARIRLAPIGRAVADHACRLPSLHLRVAFVDLVCRWLRTRKLS